MASLCKIGLKMNYVPKNLAPPSEGPSSLYYSFNPPPPGKCTSGAYFLPYWP